MKKQCQLQLEAYKLLCTLPNDHVPTPQELVRLSAIYNPQQRTSMFEDYLKTKNGWQKVSASDGCGDYKDTDGKFFELKMSSTNSTGKININQIRPWQNVDYYRVVYWDIENPSGSKEYILSKTQMEREVERRGYACHGTKAANRRNENIEYSIRLGVNNDWDALYKTNFTV